MTLVGPLDTAPARRAPTADIAVVVLTQGDRPAELGRALASVRRQQGVDVRLVLVGNGTDALPAAPGDRTLALPDNIGIPAGRNVGADLADARLVMFLDDDAELLGDTTLARVVERFDADASLGAMALRLVDEDGRTQRRHVPRLGSRSAARSGEVTHFIGACCVVRAEAFEAADGFDGRFVYAMEESDLAWRLMDAGWRIWYSADLTAFHPRTAPSRHRGYARLTARNRVWMAWRSLPAPLTVGYVATWSVLAVGRGAPVVEVVGGYRDACAALPARRPMRWRTAARMSRLGRPPVV